MAGFLRERKKRRPRGLGRASGTKDDGISPKGPRAAPGPKGPRASVRPKARAVGRRTQAERSASSEQGLLRAALELISERGFRASSLQAIGERAGYSRGLVSHRFGSKEGLLRELVTDMLDRWATDVRDPAIGGSVGVEALGAVGRAHRHAIERTPEAVRALYMLLFESLIDMPELRVEMSRLDRRLRELTKRSLLAGMKAGTVRAGVDVEAQAALFLAMLRGITLQWLVDPEALDLERVYGELHANLVRSLAP